MSSETLYKTEKVPCLQEEVEEDGRAGVKAEIFHNRKGRGGAQHESEEIRQGGVCTTTQPAGIAISDIAVGR